MRAALFVTCLGNEFFADACADAVRLLRHVGVEVDFPSAQTCCGQPALTAGHEPEARRMMEHTLSVFEDHDYVVLPSGSCAGMLRTHYPHLAESDAGRERVERLAARSYELAQFLVDVVGVEELGEGLSRTRIAYHHGCHALRQLRVEHQPVQLLRGCGATVVEWEADQECCGFGGLFSAKLPEVSAGMADRKLDTIPDVDLVASSDGGCLLQMSGRATRRGRATPFRHLASVLWKGVAG